MPYLDGPRPRVFGHRGAAGEAPENTLPSFATALAVGADHLEMDVHVTADGHVVVLHDPTVDRTTDGHGAVADYTLEALQRLDAGCGFTRPDGTRPFQNLGIQVPTLAQVLRAFPEARLNIEVKTDAPGVEHTVGAVLQQHHALDRVLLAAEDRSLLARLRMAVPTVATSFAAEEVMGFITGSAQPEYVPPGVALQVPLTFGDIEIVTPEFIAAAHRLGVEVHVWTLNDLPTIVQALAWGVDGIVTDVPGMVFRGLVDRGLRESVGTHGTR